VLKNFKYIYFLPIFIAAISFGALLGILVINSRKNNQTVQETNPDSQYISQYQTEQPDLTTEVLVGKTPETVDETVEENKQGVLETKEERKVIKFDTALSPDQITQLESQYNVNFTADSSVNGVYVVQTSSDSNISALESSDIVASVEVDQPVQLLAQTVDWGVSRVGADKIWDKTTGSGIVVAVIDTGVQLDHSDLVNNIGSGYDFVNNDINAYDDNGHGTHVAGIIGAVNNGDGTVGPAFGARIMPIKVLNASGYGYLSDVAKGIYYAVDNGARIINLSLGTTQDTFVLREAVRYAGQRGVLVVAAAGNSYGQSCVYPAAYAESICVVATDKDNKLASFSNVGGELSAPGVSNYSTYLGNRYAYLSGTSMATPHISGAAASLYSYCQTCSTTEIRQLLRDTAVDLGAAGRDGLFGYGLVDLVAAVNKLTPITEESTTIPEETTDDVEPVVGTNTPGNSSNTPGNNPKPSAVISQDLVITSPAMNNGNQYRADNSSDIKVLFGLNPTSNSSTLNRIVVHLDNAEVYSTTSQTGEHTLKMENLTNNQYVVKVVAYFNDVGQQQETFILDLTSLKAREKNNRANPNNAENKKVLGIATQFKY
jgi:subtilisin family serine protease